MKRMLDLFCGRFGWSRAFAARGWECVGVDLVEPPEIPEGCKFFKRDVLEMQNLYFLGWDFAFGPNDFDFICASSPCEEFSVHGMKHFHPNPKYPENGIRLFNHTREICEASGVPYVMENVRAAQQFVGRAVHHCGPFYLWGTGVPVLMNQGVKKGTGAVCRKLPSGEYDRRKRAGASREELARLRNDYLAPLWPTGSRSTGAARAATIPPELSACVADYAERLLETSHEQTTGVSGRVPVETIS